MWGTVLKVEVLGRLRTIATSYFTWSWQFLKSAQSQPSWLTPVMLALGRLRQEDWCQFQASLDYTLDFLPAWATEWDILAKALDCTKAKVLKS